MVRGNRQQGRAGDLAYTTEQLTENYEIRQIIAFSPATTMSLTYGFVRDDIGGQNGPDIIDVGRESHRPIIALDYVGTNVQGGLIGSAFRRNNFGEFTSTSRDERFNLDAWLQWKWRRVNLEARSFIVRGRRYGPSGETSNRERNLTVLAQSRLFQRSFLTYRFLTSAQKTLPRNTETRIINNYIDYSGTHGFAGQKGQINLDARSAFFTQRYTRTLEQGLRYVLPVSGAYLLDDTPESIDPLEQDPISEPALYDRDRDRRTAINIGDSAPIVREYGGDYRNIVYDFGEQGEITNLYLFVDTEVTFPGLIQWLVYTTDDPLGREWGPALDATAYTATYTLREDGRQGWEFVFANPQTSRWLKIVNFKLGLTEPTIFVTELEAYQPDPDPKASTTSNSSDHRLGARITYEATNNVDLIYDGRVTLRRFDVENQNLTNVSQLGAVNWRLGYWRIDGAAQFNTRQSTSAMDVENRTQSVSASRRSGAPVWYRASLTRSQEDSYRYNRISYTLAGDLNWRIAPALHFNQKVSRGMRKDSGLGTDSDSWVLSSYIRAAPRPNITVNLDRTDRWVSQEAGAGYTPFNETQLRYSWRPLTLVNVNGSVRYQERDENSWTNRHMVVWTPLPGGSLTTQFHVSYFEDSRAHSRQRGAGFNLTWRARPRLRLQAGADYYQFEQAGATNRPVNLQFRGSWTF